MEENNNVIIKGLAIILIAILGLNVYRTETTKKEMSRVADTVEQLKAQLDSLDTVECPAGTTTKAPAISKKEFTNLSKSVSSLESKVTNLQVTVDRLSRGQAQSGKTTRASSTTSGGQTSSSGLATTSKSALSSSRRVSVSAKVKVENRYVQGKTYLPKVTTGPTGVVIINVTMDRVGIVTAVTVNSGTTITDEEILDQCKEAALKTGFAFNPEAPDKSRGTITYTFTAK